MSPVDAVETNENGKLEVARALKITIDQTIASQPPEPPLSQPNRPPLQPHFGNRKHINLYFINNNPPTAAITAITATIGGIHTRF